jgi:hypothetical protein
MHIYNEKIQCLSNAKISLLSTGFDEKQYIRYQSLGERIYARLGSSKGGSDLKMIEKFYYHLLPVTFRDWTSEI